MRILMVGSGGREHALIRKLKESPRCEEIYCAPGNGGISKDAVCVDISAEDIDGIAAFAKEKNIDLTKREFELLKYMMQNKNLVITREMILAKVWGYEYMGDTNVVDVYIRYLRSKIDDQFGIKLIHTIRGVGYQIKDE